MSIDQRPRRHVALELGMTLRRAGEELHGTAAIVPEMYVPGTDILRSSILLTWADTIAGLLVAPTIAPRVPVTLELSTEVYREIPAPARVDGAGRVLKAGRSVAAVAVDFTDENGTPLAVALSSFTAAPDSNLTLAPTDATIEDPSRGAQRLTMPFAERAGCVRREPGVATLPRSDDGLNASNTINGGLIALAVEEAALSQAPGTTLASLAMRYLRPARVGPIVATAQGHGGLSRVDVVDTGADNRLAVAATTRTFAA